jgi:MFS-type transporter involved in bile tolerance (Atg22 family)
MVVDLTVAEKIGMYTGLYYLFSTLSAIVGPISNGVAIELFKDYNIIMALAPVFFLIALVLMLFVRRGEALSVQQDQLAAEQGANL